MGDGAKHLGTAPLTIPLQFDFELATHPIAFDIGTHVGLSRGDIQGPIPLVRRPRQYIEDFVAIARYRAIISHIEFEIPTRRSREP